MSKTSKRAISTLVIAIFLLSIIPIAHAQTPFTIDIPNPDTGVKGDTIVVTGAGVTSGAVVNLYWDYVSAGYLLNATEAKPAGTFEVWFDVPEAVYGEHYIWAKDTETGETIMYINPFLVNPMVKLSPSSGLPGDTVTVKGYGFDDEVVVDIQIDPFTVTNEAVGTGNGITMIFQLDYFPIVAGSEIITDTGILPAFTLDYVTGKITFGTPPDVGPITATYTTSDPTIIEASSTFETTALGSFTKDFNIPSFPYGEYWITAKETATTGHFAIKKLIIGASISLDPEEGPSGSVVTISGKGWTYPRVITVSIVETGAPVKPVGDVSVVSIPVSSYGKFSAKIVIPSLDTGEYTIMALESVTDESATADFEVTGESVIELIPGFAPPGGSVEIKGYNFTQISGTKVELELVLGTKTETIDTIETDAKGEFSETIRVPAIDYGTWKLSAIDGIYGLIAEKNFRIGIMIVIISPSYGPTGTSVYLTGIGFTSTGTWNATLDGIALTEKAVAIPSLTESISATIYIPTIPEGTYSLTVLDIASEIEVSGTFVVTAVTEVSMDPPSAPNGYNVTVKGLNFAGKIESLDFVLYNATEEWEMDVLQTSVSGDLDAMTDIDGEFTAWWSVPDDEALSLGSYTVNVTDGEGLFAQTTFSIVEERIYIKPLKDLFNIGDTVSFDIKNDFDYPDSYMEIRDPDNSLYWRTKPFDKEDDWLKDADLYTVPYYGQTSGGNPMTLSTDAPLGTWFWAFYTVDDQLVNGTFAVGPSAESLLTDQIAALSEELGIDIDTLRVYIDDLGIDMDEAVSSMAEEIATAVAAAEATAITVADIGETSQDALDAANNAVSAADAAKNAADAGLDAALAAQTTAQQAADAADQAAEAAETTQKQTSGLTGLVYGAIGASLIAALAAIVSLMQISRRIAG